ncbi:hypothetical protein IKQ21_05775 [bacterium]|nr:hypothetical protein [bacterium]
MSSMNSFVSNSEANALKEMIFNRVRERSKTMNEDVQADVMDVARESFVSKNNPFSQIMQSTAEAAAKKETEIKNESHEGTGFPQRQLKARAVEQARVVKDNITASAVQNTMDEARASLSNKPSFMGALNFLNSQAAVSMHRTPSGNFSALA